MLIHVLVIMKATMADSRTSNKSQLPTGRVYGSRHVGWDYADGGEVKQTDFMGRGLKLPSALRMAVALLATSLLAGCGMSQLTSGLGSNIFGSGKAKAPPKEVSSEELLKAARADGAGPTASLSPVSSTTCPKIVIWPADKVLTKYQAGREGDGLAVIYQGELRNVSRECNLQPDRVTVKYGFAGRVKLGTLGQKGPIKLPIRVHITDKSRAKIHTEKVDVTVAVEQPLTYFSAVRSLTITLPAGYKPGDFKLFVAFDRSKAAG